MSVRVNVIAVDVYESIFDMLPANRSMLIIVMSDDFDAHAGLDADAIIVHLLGSIR